MKTFKKIIYATLSNVLAIIATLLTVFEFFKSVIKKTLEGGTAIFIVGVTGISILAGISFVFGDQLEGGWKIFCLIMLAVLFVLLISLSSTILGIILSLITFLCKITNTHNLILICYAGIDILIGKYDSLVDNNPSKKDTVFYGWVMMLTETIKSCFGAISPILSICTYIILTILGGIWGFNTFYADEFFVETFGLIWWLNAAGTLLFAGLSLFFGFIIVDACNEAVCEGASIEEYEELKNYDE